jgi:hypothetical protein
MNPRAPLQQCSVRVSGPLARLLGLILFVTGLLPISPAHAAEVQQHGVVFEEWIRETFFDGYQPASYTQKWDIPAEANRQHGRVAVNPKAIKYRTAVGLGDALRQYDIDEPFILLVGFWQQEADVKRFVNIVAPKIHPEVWRMMWGPVTRADLERLDALIKDRSIGYQEVRRRAQAMKRLPPFSESLLVLNPKIGSDGQRRLQCSLRFDHLFSILAADADPAPQPAPSLWGVPFPGPIASTARVFAQP